MQALVCFRDGSARLVKEITWLPFFTHARSSFVLDQFKLNSLYCLGLHLAHGVRPRAIRGLGLQ